MDSTSIHGLIADLEAVEAHVLDMECHLVLQSLHHGVAVLSYDPLQLASELIGTLRQIKGNHGNTVCSNRGFSEI